MFKWLKIYFNTIFDDIQDMKDMKQEFKFV